MFTYKHDSKEISIKKEQKTRLNHEIRAREVRLIDENDNQVGVVATTKALDLAAQANLDLVEVSPHAKPPVCKILDWGKYSYKKTKQQQKGKKKQKPTTVKQIRFGLKIGEHDFNIKLKKIREFLDQGHVVRVAVFFRGREMAHTELGKDLLNDVVKQVEDLGKVEQPPVQAGKQLSLVLRSQKSGQQTENS